MPGGVQWMTLAVAAATLIGCQSSVQGRQLDVNYANTTGVGSFTAQAVHLPHGKYTMFSYADPPNCVRSVALLDQTGKVIGEDATMRQAISNSPSGGAVADQMVPSFVQREFPSGNYRLRVTASGSTCAWLVEQVLNSTLGNDAPLKPALLPSAPAADLAVGSVIPDRTFRIDVPGIYRVQWAIAPCDTYSLDLVRAGNKEHLTDGTAASVPPGAPVGLSGADQPMFLGAGNWSASVKSRCIWHVGITPWKGSLGGGSQGFAG